VGTVKNQRRVVALPPAVVGDLNRWAELSFDVGSDAWVFPTETGRPGNRDSFWRHAIEPRPEPFKLGWMNRVLRRTWSTTAAGAGISPKVRADQLGHGVQLLSYAALRRWFLNRSVTRATATQVVGRSILARGIRLRGVGQIKPPFAAIYGTRATPGQGSGRSPRYLFLRLPVL
jgi:hypothetical protein